MKRFKSTIGFVAIVGLAVALLFGCDTSAFFGGNTDSGTGTVSLSLTDAPIADAADVEGVFITITSISYNVNEEWVEAAGFEGPQEFNLLDLTEGNVAPLADTTLAAGEVTQIRFMLDVAERGAPVDGNPGCYIAFDPDGTADGDPSDDTIESLFVPSGGQTGYKANGPFTVPTNGTVEITADFDVRQSVVYAGNLQQQNGFYLLKPTIKLVVNDQAGTIAGEFVEGSTTYTVDGEDFVVNEYVVFAYDASLVEDWTAEDWTSEATPVDSESAPFPNAVTSGNVQEPEGDAAATYTLPFIAAGTYDLVVAGVDAEGAYTLINRTDYPDVVVESELPTTIDIDLSADSAGTTDTTS